jgi:ferrochelatase
MTSPAYDAVLILSFGGPEKPEEVIPFLENVLRGRGAPIRLGPGTEREENC